MSSTRNVHTIGVMNAVLLPAHVISIHSDQITGQTAMLILKGCSPPVTTKAFNLDLFIRRGPLDEIFNIFSHDCNNNEKKF